MSLEEYQYVSILDTFLTRLTVCTHNANNHEERYGHMISPDTQVHQAEEVHTTL